MKLHIAFFEVCNERGLGSYIFVHDLLRDPFRSRKNEHWNNQLWIRYKRILAMVLTFVIGILLAGLTRRNFAPEYLASIINVVVVNQ